MGFNYEKTIKRLTSEKTGKGKTSEILEDMVFSKDFMEFLFKPKNVPNLAQVVEELYAALCRPVAIKALVNLITEEGYDEFNRSHATFFYSLALIALDANNEREEENAAKRKEGKIGNREFNETKDKCEEYSKYVKKLFKCTKKIVKDMAKNISEESHIDRDICRIACYTIPEPEMIDRYKIGRLLDSFLTEMYDYAQKNGTSISGNANWKVFFRKLFGKDNLAEVATFLLLEGHNRRTEYQSDDNVIEIWDSLTEFALVQMNSAPEQLRDQMLELYLKRITKMFSNGTYELRVNLLDIPGMKSKWPQLAESVSKYADKLKEIMK